MSRLLRRVTREPATPLRILIDAEPSMRDGADLGMGRGGSYLFDPAGTVDGEVEAQVSEHAAKVIMGDPGLAPHFECIPPFVIPSRPTAPEPVAHAPSVTPQRAATATGRRRRGRKSADAANV